ncbi:hypothetical protein [Flavobacterium sp. '19STA2R22 D10 B1']|uniref:hypothetical protein n=1 Tax=Flavobacterium aerium TaxID=3037261 RepID=UPI00278BFE63|nr:hypothetical protein [Flavobacterium sp. '19STA2R22 D10 B1']
MKNLKKLSLLIITGLVVFFSCQKRNNSSIQLEGRFVNQSFLDQVKNSPLNYIPQYCTSITFIKDSVEIENGYETYKLPYTRNKNIYTIKDAFQNDGKINDLILKATTDSTFISKDSLYTTVATNSKFIKVKSSNFNQKLNQAVLVGSYKITFPKEAEGKIIKFNKEGGIENFKPYNFYELPYSGDGAEMIDTDAKMNAIYFFPRTLLYGWKYADNKKDIILYNVSPPIRDIKGGRKVLKKAYELEKIDR